MLTKDDVQMIGEEMVKILEPVYSDLDSLKKDMEVVKRTLNEHTDKIDALTVDMHQVQDELGVIKDDIREIKWNHRRDLNEVRQHIGLSPLS